jgi:hypothetical protein
LVISALGIENIGNTLSAVRLAGEGAQRGAVSSNSGQSIREWNLGKDGMLMTLDDTPVLGMGGDSGVYTPELQAVAANSEVGTALNLGTGAFDLMSTIGSSSYLKVDEGFSSALGSSDFYVSAAELISGEATENNPLDNRNLSELAGVFRALISTGSLRVSDAAFMPKLSDD